MLSPGVISQRLKVFSPDTITQARIYTYNTLYECQIHTPVINLSSLPVSSSKPWYGKITVPHIIFVSVE